MGKDEDWTPEPGDEDFEVEASVSWLTGISTGPADEFDIQGLEPKRHDVSHASISNCGDPVSC